MNKNDILMYLIAFILGYLVAKHMGNGFNIGGSIDPSEWLNSLVVNAEGDVLKWLKSLLADTRSNVDKADDLKHACETIGNGTWSDNWDFEAKGTPALLGVNWSLEKASAYHKAGKDADIGIIDYPYIPSCTNINRNGFKVGGRIDPAVESKQFNWFYHGQDKPDPCRSKGTGCAIINYDLNAVDQETYLRCVCDTGWTGPRCTKHISHPIKPASDPVNQDDIDEAKKNFCDNPLWSHLPYCNK